MSTTPYDSLNLSLSVGDDPAAVAENRRLLAARVDRAPANFVWMNQVHGATITVVRNGGSLGNTDGLVTDRVGVVLAVQVADCVPILAADQHSGVIGVAHAGRRGAAGGILPHLIATLQALGADPSTIEIRLGPAICGRCYEVPPELQRDVDHALPGSACRTGYGTTGLDLRAGLTAQAAALGIADIHSDPRCTFEDPDLFSYRRNSRTGRQAALIWRTRRG